MSPGSSARRAWRDVPWSRLGRASWRAAKVYLVAALLVAPLAIGWAIAHTQAEEQVGITPTTFRVSTTGHSELRLGIAGTVFLPRHLGPFGVVATVDGPADPSAASADLASYVSPRMLELYSGLFHDPARAVRGYVELLQDELVHQLEVTELLLTVLAGTGFLLLRRLLGPPGPLLPGGAVRRALAIVGVFLTSVAVGVVQARTADVNARPAPGQYDLPTLAGTAAEGATTNSPILRLLLGDAVPKVHQLVDRQEHDVRQYLDRAGADLRNQETKVAAPRTGEVAVLMQSDMHCNTTMIRLQKQVRTMLQGRFGDQVPAAMAITGDLTTNGTPAEGGCIRDEAAIAGGRPVAAVTGNHESEVSARQMRDAGMKVLDVDRTDVGGVSVLGGGDPNRTELFGGTRPRGKETEDDLGRRLYDSALRDRVDLVLVHEAYAAQAFIDTPDMRAFLDGRGSATVPYDDGVRDLPAGAVLYGHWHRAVEPRVVWNSDGTWTLVMELNTSGGAVASPTIGHFSTPWSTPQQEASFPVLFLDKDTGLVTGYQMYRFATDGAAVVEPRVDVGDPAVARSRVP